jgi:hypothetical protein
LPAKVPTVFVSNIRGTDDQETRARWCHDFGFALRANQADLADITKTVKQLQNPETRAGIAEKCAELPQTSGGAEIAKILYQFATNSSAKQNPVKDLTRQLSQFFLRRATLIYRFFKPHTVFQITKPDEVVFTETEKPTELAELIKSGARFEHLISGGSKEYRAKREEIAKTAYGSAV